MPSLSSSETISALKSVFTRRGIPEVVRSDNGPQYDSAEFAKFAKGWEFKNVTSIPLYAQSNGEAERTVKTAKNLLRRKMTLRKPCLHTDPHPCRVEKAHLWSPGPMHPSFLPRIFPTELARNRGLEAGGKRKEDEAKAPLRPTARSQLVTPPRPGVDPR